MDYHNYFIALENKFIEISKYVEIHEDNFKTYSSEIALTYLTVCSEFEVVAKELCRVLMPGCEPKKINHIEQILRENEPDIFVEIIDISIHKFQIKPFDGWTSNFSPSWWKSYNNVKHNRHEYYYEANIKNLIYALGALQVVNYYYIWKRHHKDLSRNGPAMLINQYPKIFKMMEVDYEGPILDSDLFDM